MSTKKERFIKIGIITFLILLLGFILLAIPAVIAANRAAYRMNCIAHLHGLCRAIQDYQFRNETQNSIPFIGDKTTGEEYWSWRVSLTGFFFHDQKTEYRLTEPWNSEYNLPLVKEHPYLHYFFCPGDRQQEKSSYVAVKGPGTVWTEMENGNLPDGFYGFGDMILIIETTEPKNHWAQPGDDVTPEEVIRLFEADPGLVKNSKQKWWNFSHWPKNYVTAIGETGSFNEIKDVEELRKRLIVSPERIEEVRKKVEERERMSQ